MLNSRRPLLVLCALVVCAMLVLLLAVFCGSSGCTRALLEDPMYLSLRLPRATSAFIVGGLLALAGALMQVLLRNPLADPYVLGLSGGAAAGALSALLVAGHLGWLGDGVAALGAALGSGVAVLLLFGLAGQALYRFSAGPHAYRLILTGVMIAAGFGAIVTLVLTLAPDAQLRGMFFWLMGDLEDSRWLLPAAVLLVLILVWSMWHAQQLNLLARGADSAQLLGVPVRRLRVSTLCAASLASAAAVTVAGTIGFIGLVVPHAMRLLFGNEQRLLLPASVLVGGASLALADLVARTLFAPTQLPVGVITALIGVPVFLWVLSRSNTA